jgi:hypothetical protein
MKRAVVAALVFAFGASACVLSKQAHDTASPRFEHAAASTTLIAVGVDDNRKEVVSGDKEASFVGFWRSGSGISHDVNTKSDAPFANDVATSLARGLQQAGYRA